MTAPQISFQDRIRNIKNPKNSFYLDPETGTFIPKRVSKHQIKQACVKEIKKPGIAGITGSLILGALCLMAARYLRWTELGLSDGSSEADVLLMIDAGIAGIAVFVLGGLLRHKTARHMAAQAVGIGIMLVTMHNLIWAFPDEFAGIYSRDYVNQVQAITEPQSLYLRGETITL